MMEEAGHIPLRNLNNGRAPVAEEDPESSNNWRNLINRYKISIAVAIGIAGFIFLVIGIIIYSSTSVHVCHSNSCDNIAKYVLKNINESVRPCENFYNFVCSKKTRYSKHSIVNRHLINLLNLLLNEISDDGPQYMKKLKKHYQSCIKYHPRIDDLKKILNEIGIWPILNKEKKWKETEFQWTEVIPNLYQKGLPANYLLSINFYTDIKNSSKKRIHLDQPHLGLDRNMLLQGFNSKIVQTYLKSMVNATTLLGVSSVVQELKKIVRFEIELAKISLPPTERAHIPRLFKPFSIKDLEINYPYIKWLDYLNGILSPYLKIDASEVIYVAVPFIDKFYDLMTNRKPTNRILANYIFWQVANDIGVHDVSDPLPEDIITGSCTIIMNGDMYLATSALFVKNYYNDTDLSEIKHVSENIRKAFNKTIQKVDWLETDTKKKILKKISQTELFIGYPKELLNDTILDAYYQDLEIPSDNFFMNKLKLERFSFKKQIENLRRPYNTSDWTGHFGNVIRTNALYAMRNAVYVFGGLMNSLFFDINYPNYMNYAMFGHSVGHEIAHSIGPNMICYDDYGNFNADWWSSESSKVYLNKTRCIVEKYNNYTYPEFGLRLNGSYTLDENIADINGLKAAYDAYVDSVKDAPEEDRLPGLEAWTPKQMFWIAFASTWCSADEFKFNIRRKILTDKHNPSRYRIIGSVTSIKEFADDFNCESTDAMNPSEKCSVWF